ncbi:MAG: hypothetical protein MZV65_44115 [Chromatiales bacterium]|nr:hypothetical protein [Chromatiales bacterium]
MSRRHCADLRAAALLARRGALAAPSCGRSLLPHGGRRRGCRRDPRHMERMRPALRRALRRSPSRRVASRALRRRFRLRRELRDRGVAR